MSVLRVEQRLQPGLERGQRGPDARPDLTIVGARQPASGREAEQLRYLRCVRGQPGRRSPPPTATSTPTQTATPHSTTTRKAEGEEVKRALRGRPDLGRGRWRGARRLRGPTRRPPGGEKTWTRVNHRGEPVTLLEGPAVAAGAVLAQFFYPERARSSARPALALALAGAGALGFGVFDDLARLWQAPRPARPPRRAGERRGHHRRGQARRPRRDRPGQRAAARQLLEGREPADVAINAGLIAGGANLLNLFDLRPGRAIKVADPVGGADHGRRAAERGAPRGGRPARRGARPAARGPGRARHARRRGRQRARRDARRAPPRSACRARRGSRCWRASSR